MRDPARPTPAPKPLPASFTEETPDFIDCAESSGDFMDLGSDSGSENILEGIISLSRSESIVDADVVRCRVEGRGIVGGGNALTTEISSSSASTLAWSSGDIIGWGIYSERTGLSGGWSSQNEAKVDMFVGQGLKGEAFIKTSWSERKLNNERASSSVAVGGTGTLEEVEGRRALDPEKTLLLTGIIGTEAWLGVLPRRCSTIEELVGGSGI